MRIAVDARELRGKPTGVGRLLAAILAEWQTMPEAQRHEVILCAPDEQDGTLWEQFDLPRRLLALGADVLFAPGYSGPVRCPIPMVVAIHDVSFAAHPEWFAWREGARRRTIVRLAARAATRIITISEFSKREIVSHLGVDGEKVVVTYPGVTSWTADANARPAGRAEADDAGDIATPAPSTDGDVGEAEPETATALYVGSIFNRRHVPELVQGFARVAATYPEARLDIVGENRTSPYLDLRAVTAATGVADRIRLRSYVGEDELPELYARSRAFAFLSEYEGFGLTPLEALGAGLPVVLLDTAVAREVCGEAAAYVRRPEPALIQAALSAVMFDPSERSRILAASAAVLARYSWTDCARTVLATLVESGTA